MTSVCSKVFSTTSPLLSEAKVWGGGARNGGAESDSALARIRPS